MNVPLPPAPGYYWYQIEIDPPVLSNFVTITFENEILREFQDQVFNIHEIEVFEGEVIILSHNQSVKSD